MSFVTQLQARGGAGSHARYPALQEMLPPIRLRKGERCARHASDEDEHGRLITRAPFHLEATVRVLQRRPGNRVDVWDRGRYLRVLPTADALVLVEVENRGTIDNPDLRFAIRSGDPTTATRLAVGLTVRKLLGLDVDPRPLHRLVLAEQTLRATARALRGMRPPRFAVLFEAFANVVPFQQLSLDAGVAIVGRLVERFGEHLELGRRRFYACPTARAIATTPLEALRECGLSGRKSESLRYLARAIESGALSEEEISRMSTKNALTTLTELPGIGPWSAALVLLRGLGRIDVFPPGDVGALRTLRALMRVRARAPLSRIIERFGDRRGYLYFCALGGNLLAKRLIQAAPE